MAAYEMTAMWAVGPGLLAPLELIGAAHPITEGPAGPLVGLAAHLVTAGYWGLKLGAIAEVTPERLRRGVMPVLLGIAWGVAVWAV